MFKIFEKWWVAPPTKPETTWVEKSIDRYFRGQEKDIYNSLNYIGIKYGMSVTSIIICFALFLYRRRDKLE